MFGNTKCTVDSKIVVRHLEGLSADRWRENGCVRYSIHQVQFTLLLKQVSHSV